MKVKLHTAVTILACTVWLVPVLATDWPTFRGNPQRTGFYPDPVGVPKDAPAWKQSLGCEIVSSPSVKDGKLYVGARDSCVYALDCATGRILWKRATGGWVDASPLVDKDRLVVGSRDSMIYALDLRSGDILGRFAAGVQLSSPVMTTGGTILSGRGLAKGGVSGYVSQSTRWEVSEPQWSVALPQYTYSSPAIYGQAAVVGATDGRFYGIDTGRKDTIWSLATEGSVYLSTPAIDDTVVYFASGDEDHNVYAANLLTGAAIWKNSGPSLAAASVNALAKRKNVRVLSVADRARLMRLRPADRREEIAGLRRTGYELPRTQPGDLPGLGKTTASAASSFIPFESAKTSSVAVGSNNVFVVQKELGYLLTNDSTISDKQQFQLQAFDKRTGAPVWSFGEYRSGSRLGYCSSPVVTTNIVFAGWGEGRIYALSAQTGQKYWEDSLQGDIVSSPAIAQGKLFVATMDGYLYAYDLVNTVQTALDFKKSTYSYPNPARGGVAHIQVYVARKAELDIVVLNFAEKPVFRMKRTLPGGDAPPFTYDWNLRGVANGLYYAIVKVKYADGKEDKKMLKIAVLN